MEEDNRKGRKLNHIFDFLGSSSRGSAQDHRKESKMPLRAIVQNRVVPMETAELSENDIIIAVMGPTGSGKSSFINMATGRSDGVGHSLESCTTDIGIVKYHVPEKSSLDIVFVDTPGFDDTHKSDLEILYTIAIWLKRTYEKDIKLAGIIYLHRITDNRMAGTPLKNLRMFEQLCGKSALQNIILATTMWDDVDYETGQYREKELQRTYWRSMIRAGSKVVRYQNSRESAWSILEDFLEQANRRYAMLLQKELVDMQRQLGETRAGQQLYSTLADIVRRQQEMLRQIRQETMRQRLDDGLMSTLKEDYEELRLEAVQAVVDMGVLEVPPGRRLQHFISRWKLL